MRQKIVGKELPRDDVFATGVGMFAEIVGLLAVAVVAVWVFKRFKLPPILAYLVTGLISGSNGLSLLHNAEDFHFVAELGIVFLLFTLGLEFSVPKLMSMRHMVFGVGTFQVIVSIAAAMLIAVGLGYDAVASLAIGGILALSSTAIVIKQMNEAGILSSNRGRLAVSILLFQDIAVVPLLIAIPLLASSGGDGLWIALLWAVLKGFAVILILWGMGKYFLPVMFNAIAMVKTDELFLLTTLLVTLIAAGLTHWFGLSMSLGAFLAGMMLGESKYRHQLEADIRPFRDILMGLFFITVGMQLDLDVIFNNWHVVALLLAATIAIKTFIIRIATSVFKLPAVDGWSTGIMLAQVGEFGFVLIALASRESLINEQVVSVLIGVGVLSMALTPWLMDHSYSVAKRILKQQDVEENVERSSAAGFSSSLSGHVIICGFGRVGQTISRFLRLEGVPYIALDVDPVSIQEAQSAGENVQFGNAREQEVLSAAGLKYANLVIVTFGDNHKAEAVIQKIRSMAPNVKILVRTRNDDFLEDFQTAGVTEVIPETLEGSLMIVSHALYLSGVPVNRVMKRVRSARQNRYRILHGFYPSEESDSDERLEFIHAVSLTENAYAVGKRLSELQLESRRVELAAFRRADKEVEEPEENIELMVQDVLILRGKPRSVERAERYLLQGHV